MLTLLRRLSLSLLGIIGIHRDQRRRSCRGTPSSAQQLRICVYLDPTAAG